jgi:hypothetical protein
VDAVLRDVDSFGADMTPGTGIDGVEHVPPEQRFLPEIADPAPDRSDGSSRRRSVSSDDQDRPLRARDL